MKTKEDRASQLAGFESETAVQVLNSSRFKNVSLSVKREDLNHSIIQGNKWHKLKLNIEAYLNGDYTSILTFGGAFSNHIYASAGLCFLLDIPCIVYVRGYQLDPDNPTLRQLKEWNATIRIIAPQDYRSKAKPDFIEALKKEHPGAYIIPEGGSNKLGFEGMLSFANHLRNNLESLPDYLCISSGTGASAAAFVEAFKLSKTRVLIFSSLKGYDFKTTLNTQYGIEAGNWEVIHDYHFGGYAKLTSELVVYLNKFYQEFSFRLDPVYTGKMFYGIEELIQNETIAPDSSVLLIHSGGLQGIAAHNYLNGAKKGYLLTE